MPKIPDEYIHSIVNLLKSNRPIGTAFVARHTELDGSFFRSYYLITCEHCITSSIVARFSNGELMSIDQSSWLKPLNGADVVAHDITDMFVNYKGNIGSIEIGLSIGKTDPDFRIGTDLFMLGLSLDEKDIGENNPNARFGNLSAFAKDHIFIEQGNKIKRPCHLGDMRSRTGFSGSPVIGYRETPVLDGRMDNQYRLFGIHSAQHKERIDVFTESDEKAIEIPSSLTRIVPAWEIEQLLNNPELVARREGRKRSTA